MKRNVPGSPSRDRYSWTGSAALAETKVTVTLHGRGAQNSQVANPTRRLCHSAAPYTGRTKMTAPQESDNLESGDAATIRLAKLALSSGDFDALVGQSEGQVLEAKSELHDLSTPSGSDLPPYFRPHCMTVFPLLVFPPS